MQKTKTREQKQSGIRTLNPATNKVEKTFEEMSDAQVKDVFNNSHEAYQSWKKTPVSERSRLLQKVAEIMRDRQYELARLCTVEMGKLIEEANKEVEISANIYEYYATHGEKFLEDEYLETNAGKAFISYESKGVIFSIQPWNFPFYQMTRSAAPNIMQGNTVVMKQASNVPQCALAMEQIFKDAGAPEHVYTNLFIAGHKATDAINNPVIQGVTFTGSEKAGSDIAAMAGKYLKKTMMELGGSDAFVVLDDADIEEAVKLAALGRLANAGQICVSPKRVIVPDSMVRQFIEKARAIYEEVKVGDPLERSTQLAPLMSSKAVDTVIRQVQDTVAAGGELIYGGKQLDREGAFMEPTILTNIRPGMVAYSEEIFGPVLCIFPVKNEKEAIRLANDTRFGLGGSVVSRDVERAIKVAREIDTGMVYINTVTEIWPELPFGGTKMSGFGREQWVQGIREFGNPKLIGMTAK